MPRFVLLRHDTPPGHDRGPHFDLMLEVGGSLRTWSLSELPCAERVIQAETLPDHRLTYLEYEGPLSGNRGGVQRVDAGEYEVTEDSAALLRIQISGKGLHGTLVLRQSELDSTTWLVEFSER